MILALRSGVELVFDAIADVNLYMCKSVLEESRPR